MQPFDALSIRAVLAEARQLIVGRKVDRVNQLGRDELLLTLRGKTGITSLFISAQSVHGRMCLVAMNQTVKSSGPREKLDPIKDRYVSKYAAGASVPNFCLLLRKHLAGATLIAAEQPLGERIVDLVFSCVDEVGTTSIKILTAEIMGRHSNLIFWEKEGGKIITASHNVTRDMSRQREIAPGLRYERPPSQERPSLYSVSKEQFLELLSAAGKAEIPFPTTEQWLITTFTGAGRHLCEEMVLAALPQHESTAPQNISDENALKLWEKVDELRNNSSHKPFMLLDLSRYSVLGWYPAADSSKQIKSFPSVNDLVEEYFRSCELLEQCNQLRERLRADLSQELNKVDARVKMAEQHVLPGDDLEKMKRCGDLILANLTEIKSGQEALDTEDLFGTGSPITIKLNPNLTSTQNAQHYYRQYAKARARHGAASQSISEAKNRRSALEEQLVKIGSARDIYELRQLKDHLSSRKILSGGQNQNTSQQKNKDKARPKEKSKILSVNSSDGWTIYVGRNRMENDHLLSRMAQPNDLWFHVLGQGGAHVLIRIPSSKQEPPQTTIQEAAQIAARLSKAAHGAKVRVVYTQCKHVRKAGKDKPGLVRYENERTVEVDTAKPMPKAMKQLFSN